MSPVLVGALLGSTVAYLKKIGKIPYTLEESLDIIMGRPLGDDVTWNNDVEVIGDGVEWKAPAPKQQKVKFPRAKADKIVKKVEKHLKPYVDKMMACGSYRRGAQMIGDIDFVVILKEGYSLPEILPSNQGVNWVGDQKAQVIIDGEKVDFRVTTPEAWGATILYFTGPADFNIKYRWMAKKRGLKLSEYGLFDRNTDKYIAGKTENDIFTALGRPYRDPADRKGFQRSAKKKAESERFYYHGTDMRSLDSILKEGIRPTDVEDSVWYQELMDVSPHPYYYEEVGDFLPSVFVADNYEEAHEWAEEAGNTEIVVLKISSQVENLANFSDDGVGGWRTSETIPKEYILNIEFFEAPYQPNQSLADYSPQDLMTSSAVTGDFTTDSLKYGFGPTVLRGEMEEYAPNETDDSFTSMSNLAYITLPDYDESYYWISDDENSRATVAFDEENEVIIIPNFEVSLRVRGQGMASQYLHEMIDDLHSDFGYYPVQVIDVDNHAIGFWEKMQNQGVIDGWTQGRTFDAEDDYRAEGFSKDEFFKLYKKHTGKVPVPVFGEWTDFGDEDTNFMSSLNNFQIFKNYGGYHEFKEAESQLPICPICEGYIPNNERPGAYPGATSRYDNKTEICSACGTTEAVAPMILGDEIYVLRDEAQEFTDDPWEIWCYIMANAKDQMPPVFLGRTP